MSEPKWTPGPWKIVREGEDDYGLKTIAICAESDLSWPEGTVAEVWSNEHADYRANAHLIAASTRLYDSLELLLPLLEDYIESVVDLTADSNPLHAMVAEAREVLAAARGETESSG